MLLSFLTNFILLYHAILGGFLVIVNIWQSFAKLFVPTQYSMGSMQFKNDKIYSELTDVGTK